MESCESLSRTVRSMLCNFHYNITYIIGSRNSHCLANESNNSIFPSPFKMSTPGPEAFSDKLFWVDLQSKYAFKGV